MSDVRETDGQRLKRLRKRAGLSQAEFGRRMGRSQAWVSGVERDDLTVDSIAMLNRAARVLNVHPNELTGRPYHSSSPTEERGHAAIGEIRRVVQRFDLPPDWPVEARPLPELRAAVGALTTLRRQARYAHLGEAAPAVLRELHAAASSANGSDVEQVYGLLSLAYREADTVAHALGYEDLSTLTTERVRWAAARSGDPLLVAVGEYLRVRDLWTNDLWGDALGLIDRTLEQLADAYRSGDPSSVSVWGSLQLRAAVTAARSCDDAQAWERLGEAREAVERLPVDRPGFDPYELTFTETNVDMHGVSLAVELRQGERAVELSRDVHLPASTPPSRAGHHLMDVARGSLYASDYDRALVSMQRAEHVAPMLVRNHPMAHAAVHTLLSRARAQQEPLRRLADRMHVL